MSGEFIYLPRIKHECLVPPNNVRNDKYYKSIWKCGECGARWRGVKRWWIDEWAYYWRRIRVPTWSYWGRTR
jgi:hypothetical protein